MCLRGVWPSFCAFVSDGGNRRVKVVVIVGRSGAVN